MPVKRSTMQVREEQPPPTWEIAHLFPAQGKWTEDDYLSLDRIHDHFPLLELSDGKLELLPMPTQLHQLIAAFLFGLLKAYVDVHAPGVVLFSGMRVRLKKGRFRDPDVLYMKAEHSHRRHEKYWDGADLAVEVVSADPKDRARDLEVKPVEYARAGIPEYWIVDPRDRFIRVLTLRGRTYKVHGTFRPGSQVTSLLLPGFVVAVDEALAPPGSESSH